VLKPPSECLCRLPDDMSLLCLECPRRWLWGVLDTEDPGWENDGEVYCGCETGGGAAC